MERLIELIPEYKKAIATAVVGALLYFGKSYLPELFTTGFVQSLEIPAIALFVYYIGRWTRMPTSDAELLEEVKDDRNQV